MSLPQAGGASSKGFSQVIREAFEDAPTPGLWQRRVRNSTGRQHRGKGCSGSNRPGREWPQVSIYGDSL